MRDLERMYEKTSIRYNRLKNNNYYFIDTIKHIETF